MNLKVFLVVFLMVELVENHEGSHADIMVVNDGHSEAKNVQNENPKPTEDDDSLIEGYRNDVTVKTESPATDPMPEPEDVIFIPNDTPEDRKEVYNYRDKPGFIEDAKAKTTDAKIEFQESPMKDIYFVSGKNEASDEKGRRTSAVDSTHSKIPKETRRQIEVLDCKHLDCSKTLKSVCGGKKENGIWKYRAFLNECFFRKVNCAFKFDFNRYKNVSTEKCKFFGVQYSRRRNSSPVSMNFSDDKFKTVLRQFSSRRTLNQEMNGNFCGHTCPMSCPDEYDPQCALSTSGQKRVFLNHCKMDFNSCAFGIAWHKQPLSNCVGGRKADMRQNRGFVNWLQRSKIVDKKGRLVLGELGFT